MGDPTRLIEVSHIRIFGMAVTERRRKPQARGKAAVSGNFEMGRWMVDYSQWKPSFPANPPTMLGMGFQHPDEKPEFEKKETNN